MKVGILSPTTWQLVEKMAALFPEGVEVVGPLADDRHYWNDYTRKMSEWSALDLKVTLNLKPYDAVDFHALDLLVASVETFMYAKDWANHCERIECPTLLKACWTRRPQDLLPESYTRKVREFPVLLEMPAHVANWTREGFTDVNVVYNPVGEWWFRHQWRGANEQVLFVLSGTRSWRPDGKKLGLDVWEKICQAFPGKTFHHDGHERYRTSLEMVDLYRDARVFVNLDQPFGQGERPLTLAFTEALSAGLPVVARDLPGLSYAQFIDSNGVCTDDLDTICAFIDRCLRDYNFARECSRRSRELGRKTFAFAALRPQYDAIIARARQAFDRRKST